MAEYVKNGTEVNNEELNAGETKYYCRCMRSKAFPFCDGSHEVGSLRTLAVTAKKEENG